MKNIIGNAVLTVLILGYVAHGAIVGHVGLGVRRRWEFHRDSAPEEYWMWMGILAMVGMMSFVLLTDSIKKNRDDKH